MDKDSNGAQLAGAVPAGQAFASEGPRSEPALSQDQAGAHLSESPFDDYLTTEESSAEQEAADVSVAPPWWRSPALVGLLVLAVLGIVGVVLALAGVGQTTTVAKLKVQGSLVIADETGYTTDGTSCAAASGYDDLIPGAKIVISAKGKTLKNAKLEKGFINGSGQCEFDFHAEVSSGKGAYDVRITQRGTQTYSEAEMTHIRLSLGG